MPRGPVEASGGTMANIVKANTYLIDISHRVDYGQVREEFFERRCRRIRS
jgi:hypothetical protein